MLIKDSSSLKKFFRKVKQPIFGAGVYAFNRLGPEEFLENYKILSLYSFKDTELIKKDIPVFCLEEKIGRKLRPRNSSTLLSNPESQKYIRENSYSNSRKLASLLPYKSSKRIKKEAFENSWGIAAAPRHFVKNLFENKAEFRKILFKLKIPTTLGRIISFPNFWRFSFKNLGKEFGIPFVIQHPQSGGGKGTFLVNNEKELIKVKESLREKSTEKIIIAEFIKGPSPSIVGCVTRFGVLSARPQYQLCDIPSLYSRPFGFGLFCGHNWSASDFSKKILNQTKETVGKVGSYFQKLGYKGIFGLDFVLDLKQEQLYLTECNPRLLGSFPTLTMVQIANNEPPIIAFHLLEFLNVSYKIDLKGINNLMWQKKKGAQMFLHSPYGKEEVLRGKMEAGIYRENQKSKIKNQNVETRIYKRNQKSKMTQRGVADDSKNQKIEFLRPGYKFSHLRNKDEFLLTDGIQRKGAKIQPYQRICRILTKERVLSENLKDIRQETKNFIKLALKKLNISEINRNI